MLGEGNRIFIYDGGKIMSVFVRFWIIIGELTLYLFIPMILLKLTKGIQIMSN